MGILLSPAFRGAAPPAAEPFQHPFRDRPPQLPALVVLSSSCGGTRSHAEPTHCPRQRASTQRGPEPPGGGAEIRGLKLERSGTSRGDRPSRTAHVTRRRLSQAEFKSCGKRALANTSLAGAANDGNYSTRKGDLLIYLHIFS